MSEQPFDLSRLDDAHHRIGAMCKNGHPPKMSIPARPEHDDDLVICKTLEDAGKELTSLRAQLAASREALRMWVTPHLPCCKLPKYDAPRGECQCHTCNCTRATKLALSPPSDGGVGGWREIETAPRDGTIFIAGHGRTPAMIEMIHFSQRITGFPWSNGIGNFKADYFTHWQPLPTPPTQASDTSSEGGEG